MTRLLVLSLLVLGIGAAAAQTAAPSDPRELVAAKQEAEQARLRSERLEQQAARATGEAEQARARSAALAARIEAAEAEITASEARVRLVEQLRREQRARLAAQQAPLIRLTAALQTMARRPPALALIQPGSVDEVVHVRALLASTLPEIRARTEGLRAEVARGNALRRQAEIALAALEASQADLRGRRIALARFEARQRTASQGLMESALNESDRALAFGERARELDALQGTRAFQEALRGRLASLPAPALRPVNPPADDRRPSYALPVQGRLVTGAGELSDAGIHARGLTFDTAADAPVVAPAPGRIVYARPFRAWGEVVIVDHGGGWTTTITNLGALAVREGDRVGRGDPLGRAAGGRVSVELRRNGTPMAITNLL
ncbi:MAG: murein hydrolase activator [Sphingomonadales bacterium]|nr:murein hydrolase activator [Sphingomonadales bacterium]MEA3034852.1 murein hydrolase activator [Sphingomonadales bacterium]